MIFWHISMIWNGNAERRKKRIKENNIKYNIKAAKYFERTSKFTTVTFYRIYSVYVCVCVCRCCLMKYVGISIKNCHQTFVMIIVSYNIFIVDTNYRNGESTIENESV